MSFLDHPVQYKITFFFLNCNVLYDTFSVQNSYQSKFCFSRWLGLSTHGFVLQEVTNNQTMQFILILILIPSLVESECICIAKCSSVQLISFIILIMIDAFLRYMNRKYCFVGHIEWRCNSFKSREHFSC